MLRELADDVVTLALAFEKLGYREAATDFLRIAEQILLEANGAEPRELPEPTLRQLRSAFPILHSRPVTASAAVLPTDH